MSSHATTFPFMDFAQALADGHKGRIVQRLGLLGSDEVYWDIQIAGQILTLHSQHFLGVFLCATDKTSEELLRRLVPFAEAYLRDRQKGSLRYWLTSAWRRTRAILGLLGTSRG